MAKADGHETREGIPEDVGAREDSRTSYSPTVYSRTSYSRAGDSRTADYPAGSTLLTARWPKRVIALAIAGLALLVRAPLLPRPGFVVDQVQFLVWSAMSRTDGLSSVYRLRPDDSGKYWCNYPPGYVYVLRLLAGVYPVLSGQELDNGAIQGFAARDGSSATRWAAALYKLPAVVADAMLGATLFLLLTSRMTPGWAAGIALIYVMMPVVIHDSAVWGQVDAIPMLVVIASLEAARRRRLTWMSALAVLAVLTKPQAAIVAPIWVMVGLLHLNRNWRRWAQAVLAAAVAATVLLLPFSSVLDGLWQSLAGAASYYPFTHLNGFSIWFLGSPLLEPHLGDPLAGASWHESLYEWYAGDHLPGVLGVTPRCWGLIAFGCVAAYCLAALWRGRCCERSLYQAARILPLAFFVLSTQMHERYLFPAVALWAWAAIPSRRWLICWLLLGACASINMLWSWAGPADAFWTAWSNRLFHRTWLGAAPGTWCCLLLCGILASTVFGWVDARRPGLGVPRRPRGTSAATPAA